MARGKKSRYLNRELSWLAFNERVLAQALDESVPVLERVRFLAITSSNLDEFFMVRVGGLRMLQARAPTKRDASGLNPEEQLALIHARAGAMAILQNRCWSDLLEPRLAAAGIRRLLPAQLSVEQCSYVAHLFEQEIYPVLSPIGVRRGRPGPLLTNQVLHFAVRLKTPAAGPRPRQRFAMLPIARNLSRLVTLPSESGYCFILLEDVVGMHIDRFFPGESIAECLTFRITRNADLAVREDFAEDLLADMAAVLLARKRSRCVRLEIAGKPTKALLRFMQRAAKAASDTLYVVPGPLDLAGLMPLAQTPGADPLRYEPWPPQRQPEFGHNRSMFDVISEQDRLVSLPYDPFDPVVRLLEEAAEDPGVVAIKQVLYRTSQDSRIVAALARAATNGKHVTAIVELKARFDEARNIERARALEDAGVQVLYGVKGLKTHAKICLIVRREPGGLRRYMHFGTGNYNETTARLYSDVGYMTCDEDLGRDASAFLNSVTGYSQPQRYTKLAAAPLGLRDRFLELIRAEINWKKQGRAASIMAKVNALVDPGIIDALYEASAAGVEMQLNVRGICCLRPGVRGLSPSISVVSIVDRFLEHARMFVFQNGGKPRVFISSADWMPRNLDRRIELLVPIEEPRARTRVIETMRTYFKDNTNAWRLGRDGEYRRVHPHGRQRRVRAQQVLYEQARALSRRPKKRPPTMFEPHRAPARPAGPG